ncbi:MAG: hypothetical protein U0703_27840 [Anaerolineae bacterium]
MTNARGKNNGQGLAKLSTGGDSAAFGVPSARNKFSRTRSWAR